MDARDRAGHTPLCVACVSGQAGAARRLLERGADAHSALNCFRMTRDMVWGLRVDTARHLLLAEEEEEEDGDGGDCEEEEDVVADSSCSALVEPTATEIFNLLVDFLR